MVLVFPEEIALPKDVGLKELSALDSKGFRPIHYLGSKLRLLPEIERLVDELDPSKGRVCDLFSGSGTVSYFLSRMRPVTSVDIQEYSALICSALLMEVDEALGAEKRDIFNSLFNSKIGNDLSWALDPLINYENASFVSASKGSCENLCDLIEKGSIYAYQAGLSNSRGLEIEAPIRETVSRLKTLDYVQKNGALITRYFGGAYFSYQQALVFDLVLERISSIGSQPLKNNMRAALLSAMSDTVNTIGKQFAQPIKPRSKDGNPKLNLIKKILSDRMVDPLPIFNTWLDSYLNLPRSSFKHRVFKGDYMAYLNSVNKIDSLSVIYADPPYTRDHYSRFYHVLETVCLEDEPKVSIVKSKNQVNISRGLYRGERHQSPFSIISEAPNAFQALFSGAAKLNVPLLLSYSPFSTDVKSRPRVIGMDDLLKLARQSYRNVEVVPVTGFVHSKLNSSELNFSTSEKAELFIVCRN